MLGHNYLSKLWGGIKTFQYTLKINFTLSTFPINYYQSMTSPENGITFPLNRCLSKQSHVVRSCTIMPLG